MDKYAEDLYLAGQIMVKGFMDKIASLSGLDVGGYGPELLAGFSVATALGLGIPFLVYARQQAKLEKEKREKERMKELRELIKLAPKGVNLTVTP